MMRFVIVSISRYTPAMVLMFFIISAFSCMGKPGSSAANNVQNQAGQPPAVVIEEVQPRTISIPSEFVARTIADQTVEIRARIEGILIEASFEEGKLVTKDQILFRINPALYEANLQNAKAQLAKACADLKLAQNQVSIKAAESQIKQTEASLLKADQDVARVEPLVRDEAVPQQDLDSAIAKQKVSQADLEAARANRENVELSQRVSIEQAQAAVESGKAAVAKAELDLSYTTIKSPIDGIIGRQQVSVGNLVGRGEPTLLATVSTTDPMRVDFSISEADYLMLMKKREEIANKQEPIRLELVLADGSIYPHKGTVVMFERGLDPTTATIPIGASFSNPDGLLRPGLFARVRVEVRKIENALLVPQRAVIEMQGAKTVMVAGPDNLAAVRTIVLGDRFEKYFVVQEGLQAGDRVIVEGQQKARPGKPVTPAAPVAEERK
ncbi:MAG TPA: efflux RND transporter periplasmic adaptor subunit [Candidatus Hydrogenedentes bacterium]|nr:efflux RND transporter periplasmic adaptor subunit [Candidatus Hydrogenedentota bacterium]